MTGAHPRRFGIRAAAGACLAGLVILFASSLRGWRLPPLGPGLWIGDVVGYLAFFVLLLLFAAPVRHRVGRGPAPMVLRTHRVLGYAALVLVVAHALITLVLEPVSFEYWLPTGPIYMLAGLLAVVLMLLATLPAEHGIRHRLYLHYDRFRGDHLWVAFVVVVLTAAHVLGSDGVPAGPIGGWAWAILSATAVIAVGRRFVRVPRA